MRGTMEEGAKLLETVMALDWRVSLMAKGIMWDRKRIPDTMLNMGTIRTINQFILNRDSKHLLPRCVERLQLCRDNYYHKRRMDQANYDTGGVTHIQ